MSFGTRTLRNDAPYCLFPPAFDPPRPVNGRVHICVAGGGIGGLCAALCLIRHGFTVSVLEQAETLAEVGAGIQLSPNAMRVMNELGLSDALLARGFQPEAIEARLGVSGLRLFRIPLGERARARWGAPYLHIHRADLMDVLAEALRAHAPDALRLGTAVSGYSQDAGTVAAELDGGGAVRADALIGADGIHSRVATRMLGPAEARFTGNVAWRAVVPVEHLGPHAPPPTACVWMGEGRHAVTYRLRGGALANVVGVVEQDGWTDESWSARGTREDALADFGGWHPVITTALENADAHHRWALFDRDPRARWTDGRVALLGDAAHPMLPFMAQGAAMAVEDGWVLAAALAGQPADIPSALRGYARARMSRTAAVQAASRANMKTFHRRTLPAKLGTYGPMWLAGHLAPWAVHGRQDWIYGRDVTAPG